MQHARRTCFKGALQNTSTGPSRDTGPPAELAHAAQTHAVLLSRQT